MPLRGRNEAVARVTAYLEAWLPWTLRQVTIPAGRLAGWLPAPVAYTQPVGGGLPPDNAMPFVVVTVPTGRRRRETRGEPSAGIYDLVVTAVVRGGDWAHTGQLVGGYGAALRSLLDRRDAIDDTLLTEVTSEAYGPAFDPVNSRTLAEVVLGVTAVVQEVDDLIWPASPPLVTDPPVSAGVVDTVHVDLTRSE